MVFSLAKGTFLSYHLPHIFVLDRYPDYNSLVEAGLMLQIGKNISIPTY